MMSWSVSVAVPVQPAASIRWQASAGQAPLATAKHTQAPQHWQALGVPWAARGAPHCFRGLLLAGRACLLAPSPSPLGAECVLSALRLAASRGAARGAPARSLADAALLAITPTLLGRVPARRARDCCALRQALLRGSWGALVVLRCCTLATSALFLFCNAFKLFLFSLSVCATRAYRQTRSSASSRRTSLSRFAGARSPK
jgi:hypothetical protein